jgi:hypothetical protein
VKVRLFLLGFDQTLWGDLEHFTSKVQLRYYHEVTGQPMFTVNFGGRIGIRFANDQWNEPNLTLLRSRDNFTGPTLGPTVVHNGLPLPADEYFLKYWLPHILERIV